MDFSGRRDLTFELSVCYSSYHITGVTAKAGLDVRGCVSESLSCNRDNSASIQRPTTGENVSHLKAVSNALGTGPVKKQKVQCIIDN